MTVAGNETLAGRRRRTRGKLAVVILVAAGLAGFVAANAHFVYVSIMSEPDCVPHVKSPASDASGLVYQAAKSSC